MTSRSRLRSDQNSRVWSPPSKLRCSSHPKPSPTPNNPKLPVLSVELTASNLWNLLNHRRSRSNTITYTTRPLASDPSLPRAKTIRRDPKNDRGGDRSMFRGPSRGRAISLRMRVGRGRKRMLETVGLLLGSARSSIPPQALPLRLRLSRSSGFISATNLRGLYPPSPIKCHCPKFNLFVTAGLKNSLKRAVMTPFSPA